MTFGSMSMITVNSLQAIQPAPIGCKYIILTAPSSKIWVSSLEWALGTGLPLNRSADPGLRCSRKWQIPTFHLCLQSYYGESLNQGLLVKIKCLQTLMHRWRKCCSSFPAISWASLACPKGCFMVSCRRTSCVSQKNDPVTTPRVNLTPSRWRRQLTRYNMARCREDTPDCSSFLSL